MKNTVIEKYRKVTSQEKGKDGVYRPRTRPFVKFKCSQCQEIVEIRDTSYKEDVPCAACKARLAGKKRFFQRAKDKFGDQFDLRKAEEEYFDATTHVTVRCVKHDHEYRISPTRFVAKPYPNQPAKGGCPLCAKEIQLTKNKKSISYYLAMLEDKFPDISVVSHGTAENNLELIHLSCPIHGEFTKTLAKVQSTSPLRSKLCTECTMEQHAWRTRMARTDVPGLVYFVKFNDVNLYKLGVTYRSTKERLRGHLQSIDILWEIPFDTLSDAYFFEYQMFREYSDIRTAHPDNTLGGYTEFFSAPITQPLQPFIEEILCRKESNSGEPLPAIAEGNPEPSLYPEEGATTIPQGSRIKWSETVLT